MNHHLELWIMSNKFEIDGSELEGGGQILRISTALSAILPASIFVKKIRAGRSNPGLRAQHLTGLQLIRDLTGGNLVGGQVHSSTIEFTPRQIIGGQFEADVKTAGSLSLLVQSCLPVALYGKRPTKVLLTGGTDVSFAPPIDYLSHVFLKLAERLGIDANIKLNERGFFPKGGGKVTLEVTPLTKRLRPIKMIDPGNIVRYQIVAFTAGKVPSTFGEEMKTMAEELMRKQLGEKLVGVADSGRTFVEPRNIARNNGGTIHVWVETSTGCVFGGNAVMGKNSFPKEMAKTAVEDLAKAINVGSCVDDYMQDQLIIFMALADGKSAIRTSALTMHTKTAIHVIEKMTKVKYSITEDKGTFIIECEGLGVSPQQ